MDNVDRFLSQPRQLPINVLQQHNWVPQQRPISDLLVREVHSQPDIDLAQPAGLVAAQAAARAARALVGSVCAPERSADDCLQEVFMRGLDAAQAQGARALRAVAARADDVGDEPCQRTAALARSAAECLGGGRCGPDVQAVLSKQELPPHVMACAQSAMGLDLGALQSAPRLAPHAPLPLQ